MRIALDYDGTYTLDSQMWNRFIALAQEHGHEVICVTQRFPDEPAVGIPCEVIYTSRQTPKAKFVLSRFPDVWIDDEPHRIFQAAP